MKQCVAVEEGWICITRCQAQRGLVPCEPLRAGGRKLCLYQLTIQRGELSAVSPVQLAKAYRKGRLGPERHPAPGVGQPPRRQHERGVESDGPQIVALG